MGITRTWNVKGSGNWSLTGNWSPSGVPAAGDDVVINPGVNSTITLDVDTASLNSLAISTSKATLAIGAHTLNIASTAGSAINLAGGGIITIAGGKIVDVGGVAFGSGNSAGNLSGFGTLSVAGHYSGTGTLQASGGLLDVFGTVDGGVTLSIGSATASTLRIEGAATAASAIGISSTNQTLEIGTGGSLTITAVESITNGTIKLGGPGSTLTTSSGKLLTIGSGATLSDAGGAINASGAGGGISVAGLLSGSGIVNLSIGAVLSGAGTVKASGGVLEVNGPITGMGALQVGSASGDTLKLDGTSTATAASFLGMAGTLEVNTGGTLNVASTLAIGANTVKLDGASSTLTDAGGVTLGGGTISGLGTLAANTNLTGYGIVSIPVSSAGTITASGGTLDLIGSVSNRTLAISSASASDLKIDGTTIASSAIAMGNLNQTLEVGATGSLTINANENIGGSAIKLDGVSSTLTMSADKSLTIGKGGTLTDAGGKISASGGKGGVSVSGVLSGFGLINLTSGATLSGAGTVRASGGTLEVNGPIASIGALQVDPVSGGMLKLDGASSATNVTLPFSNTGTLEVNTGGTLTVTNALAIGANTVKLDGASSTLTDAAGITLGGGAISGSGTLAVNTNLTGYGTVSIPISSAGTITAIGGTLDLIGSVSNRTLAISSASVSDLKIDGTATSAVAIAISSANQTLEIGTAGSLSINAAESISNGTIKLDGGALIDASGVSLGAGAHLNGFGSITAGSTAGTDFDGSGNVTASGGTLEFKTMVDGTSASSFDIANTVGSVLKFDGVVGSGSIRPTVTFDGGSGILDLSSDTLANFHGTVANFASGEGIKVNGASAAVLDPSGLFVTIYDVAHNALGTINLASSYIGDDFKVAAGIISVEADTTVPSGGTPVLASASDSGSSSTNNITNVTAPTFSVALSPSVAVGDTVQLLLDGSPLAHPMVHTITFADIDAGSVNLTVTAGDLGTDGVKSISAKFMDLAGHTSTTPALALMLDQDLGEQAALTLGVNGGTPIGAAIASAVPFAAAGFEADDNGSVSFSDGSHAPIVVSITSGVLAATTADLSALNDGPITATLHLNRDAAGNSFTDVVVHTTLAHTVPAFFTLTPGTDILPAGLPDGTLVVGTASTLNASDQLAGGGHDVLALNGAGTFDLTSLAQFSGFSTIDLANPGSGSQTLYLPGNQTSPVDIYLGSGSATVSQPVANGGDTDSYHLSTGDAVIQDNSASINLYTDNGPAIGNLTLNQTYSSGSQTFARGEFDLSSGTSSITRSYSVYRLDTGSTYVLSSGSATITENYSAQTYLTNDGDHFVLSSGPAVIEEHLHSDTYLYNYNTRFDLSSGSYSISIDETGGQIYNQGAFGFFTDTSASFASGDSIRFSQSGSVSGVLDVAFALSGTDTYSLAAIESVYSGDFELRLYPGSPTLKLDGSMSSVTSISGDGTDTVETSASTLDLTGTVLSGVQISSTNASGTTFTVSSLAAAQEVIGGLGEDTLVANGFTFTDSQRSEIFAQGSVDLVEDAGGLYLKPGQSRTVDVAGGINVTSGGYNDTFVFGPNFGNDTVANFATTSAAGANHDTLDFHGVFVDAMAAFNAAQDVGGNVVISADASDSVTLLGVHKADLSVSDFKVT